jgi:hypothetical protein
LSATRRWFTGIAAAKTRTALSVRRRLTVAFLAQALLRYRPIPEAPTSRLLINDRVVLLGDCLAPLWSIQP